MSKLTLKFGGSALNSPENINRVCQIILKKALNNDCYVVVSALKGSTEKLIGICNSAKTSAQQANTQLLELIAEHQLLANKILSANKINPRTIAK